jgi:glycosyltransferase involved in cell wall biosynthesis
MYFVQDFEPLFSPMGTEYILAENTYRQGLYCITSGPWCEVVLKRDFDAEADHFEFPIDRSVYFPRPRTQHAPYVLYFAKPEMPRRCYELGVMMLREFHRLAPEVEIIMYGSRNVDLGTLGFPATLQGVLPTTHDLAQAYANADLGIAFSTTNPSLVPYEMMACGTPVVDLGRPGNEVNYGGRFDVALLADPEPARMARQVRDLLRNPAEREARSKAGIELVARMPTEEQMARQVEDLILRRLAR